jgi:hypothetical protein
MGGHLPMGIDGKFARVREDERGEQGEGFDGVGASHLQVVGHLARRLFGEADGEKHRIIGRDWRYGVAKNDRDLPGI